MSKTNAYALLEQMLECASRATSYIEGLGKADFLADTRTQEAVSMNLINIGEAATKLWRDHSTFLTRHPQVPWRSMLAMRNRIAHNYWDLDFDVIWDTVNESLPELVLQLPSIIRDAKTEPGSRASTSDGDL